MAAVENGFDQGLMTSLAADSSACILVAGGGLPAWRRVWACLCLLLALSAAPSVHAGDAVLLIDRAQRWTLDGAHFDGEVALPDHQVARELAQPGGRRYRVSVDWEALKPGLALGRAVGLQTPLDDTIALYVERACSELTVRVNGAVVHHARQPDFSRFQDCYGPQLLSIPQALMRPGTNEIELDVHGWPLAWVSTARRAAGLSELRLGAHDELADLYRREATFGMSLPAIVSGGLFLLALLTLCLMAFAPRQRHLAYFALTTVLWASLNARAWWSLPLDSPGWREGLLVALTAVVSWSYQRFVCLYADFEVAWLDRLGTAQLLLMPLLITWGGPEHLFTVATLGHLYAAGVAVASTVLFLMHALEPRRRPMRGMAVVFALALCMVCLELLVGLGLVEAHAYLPLRWGFPMCLVLMGALQMMEFGRQAHLLEGVQRQLEHKIELARQEIEANFTQLAQDRIEKVTSVERKRIAADLHDDLGAKLLTIVHTSRSDRIAMLGREALDEMRLSVRGLTGRPMELSEALADWRTEAMTRLGPTGIELDWPLLLEDLPQVLGARTMVQTTRILREVLNNLIRHSQATHCQVRTSVNAERLMIEITDNGIGFEIQRLNARQAGLGLLNMQHRARQLHGECVIESTPGQGSQVRLSLPLRVPSA